MSWLKEQDLRNTRNLKSFYVLLKSDACIDVFPKNNSTYFRNKLNREYILSDEWSVALCDLQIHKSNIQNLEKNIWVFCDIITETQIGPTDEQLLRRVPIRENEISRDWFFIDIQNTYYMPLKTTTLTEIGIKIDTAPQNTQLPNIESIGSTSLLLHFKKNYNGGF